MRFGRRFPKGPVLDAERRYPRVSLYDVELRMQRHAVARIIVGDRHADSKIFQHRSAQNGIFEAADRRAVKRRIEPRQIERCLSLRQFDGISLLSVHIRCRIRSHVQRDQSVVPRFYPAQIRIFGQVERKQFVSIHFQHRKLRIMRQVEPGELISFEGQIAELRVARQV